MTLDLTRYDPMELLKKSATESTDVASKVTLSVTNPDGSSIGSLQERSVTIFACESTTGVVAVNADSTAITTSTNHIQGTLSISFAKSGTASGTGGIKITLPSALNLAGYEEGIIRFYVNLSDITNVMNVLLFIGTDTSNAAGWQIPVSQLKSGWNALAVNANSISQSVGTGINWSAVAIVVLNVTFGSSANTLSAILVDGISAIIPDTAKFVNTAAQGQTSNSTVVSSFQNSLPMARYNISPTARTDGQFGNQQADVNGNLQINSATLISGEDQTNLLLATQRKPVAISTYAWSSATSTAYEASHVVKASSGFVRSIEGYNAKASVQFIQLHNATALPSDTSIPTDIIAVPGSSNFTIDYGEDGFFLSTGIVVCNSSTGPTKTIGSADCWFTVKYK